MFLRRLDLQGILPDVRECIALFFRIVAGLFCRFVGAARFFLGSCRPRFRVFRIRLFRLIRFGGFFIRIAAVVGFVEPTSFKHNGRAGSELANRFFLSAFRALFYRIISDFLKQFPGVFAGIANVVVSWHGTVTLDYVVQK